MAAAAEDWAAVVERLSGGDRQALLQVTRLLYSFLHRWRAFDFREDWEDLIQEVALAAALALREGKLRDRGAAHAYLRNTLRFKYVDRLRLHLRQAGDDQLALEDHLVEAEVAGTPEPVAPEERGDVSRALEALPEKHRSALVRVYLQGQTYPEAAADSGVPLGTLKRHLRDGLAQLRDRLCEKDAHV